MPAWNHRPRLRFAETPLPGLRWRNAEVFRMTLMIAWANGDGERGEAALQEAAESLSKL